jgi:hypothetical protein
VSDSSIGIKVADGSYYPVLESGYTGTKKLTVTTAKDNQDKVQIDLYSGAAPSKAPERYIGTLVIENIPPATQGEPEIELTIGIDEDGQLSAQASDSSTGESQNFSTSMAGLPAPEESPDAEFSESDFPEDGILDDETLEGELPATGTAQTASFEEPPLTGETYPAAKRVTRKGPNILLLILFVVFGMALVLALAYFIYRTVQGPRIPALTGAAATAPAQPAAPKEPAAAPAAAPAAPKEPAAPAAAPQPEVTYRIKNGDTLWDISASYYRNPWLYPRLAKANAIKNPDLIFAGTRITIPEN